MALMSLDEKTFSYRFYSPITVGMYSISLLEVTVYPPEASLESSYRWVGRKILVDGTVSIARPRKVLPFTDYEGEASYVLELLTEATKQKIANPQAIRFELPW